LHEVHHVADDAMLGGEKPLVAPGLHHGRMIAHDAYTEAYHGTSRSDRNFSGDSVPQWRRKSTLSSDQSEREERHVGSA